MPDKELGVWDRAVFEGNRLNANPTLPTQIGINSLVSCMSVSAQGTWCRSTGYVDFLTGWTGNNVPVSHKQSAWHRGGPHSHLLPNEFPPHECCGDANAQESMMQMISGHGS